MNDFLAVAYAGMAAAAAANLNPSQSSNQEHLYNSPTSIPSQHHSQPAQQSAQQQSASQQNRKHMTIIPSRNNPMQK